MNQTQIYLGWLRRGLDKPGKTQKGLARALNLDPMQVSRLVNGKRKFQLADLATISMYIDVPIPELQGGLSPGNKSTLVGVRAVGRIGASVWQDGKADLGIVTAYADPRFPASDQLAFVVDQDLPDRDLMRGSIVMAVDLEKYRHYARESALCIFEKRQGTLTNYQVGQLGTKNLGAPTRLVIAAVQPLI